MPSFPLRVLVVLGAIAAGSSHAAASAAIPLWIMHSGNTPVRDVPLRAGIPLPRGLLGSEEGLRLGTEGGAEHLVQGTVLERWPDGSIRWLIADLVLPTLAPGRTEATLTVDRQRSSHKDLTIAASGTPPPTIRSTHLAVTVGPAAEFTVRVLGTTAPELRVSLPTVITDRAGPSSVRDIRVVSAGPVRAEIAIETTHPGGLSGETRIVSWAGTRLLLIRHTVVNRERSPTAPIRAMPLAIAVGDIAEAQVLLDGASHAVAPGEDGSLRLTQVEATAVTSGGAPAGTQLGGAVRVRSPELGVDVFVPEFWQQYPVAMEVSADSVTVDLLAGGVERPVHLGVGAAKSHDVWILPGRPADAPDPEAFAALLDAYPRAVAPPQWTRASGAVAGALDPGSPTARAFLARLRSDALRYDSRARHERWDDGPPGPCEARERADPRRGFFGALNWGDWNFPGYRDGAKECDAWGNLEYDLPVVFGLAWLATGDPSWAIWFDRALAHYRDVDIIHAAPERPQWIGLNHPHKVGHFDWRAKSKVDLGHTWLEGLLLHHRLTGDERSGAAAMRMADRLALLADRARNPRHFGWPMIALAAAADAGGDRHHRAAALRYATLARERFPPDPSLGDWKLGILASGLAAVHRLTRDDVIGAWLRAYGERLLASERPAELDPRYVAVAGYLASLTGDGRFTALADTVATQMPIGTWGKTLAMHGRVGFELLGVMADPESTARRPPDVRPVPAAPPPVSDPAPPPP